MELNIEDLWSRINPELTKERRPLDTAAEIRFLQKHGIAHQHNILTADIIESERYQYLSKRNPDVGWGDIKEVVYPLLTEVLEFQKEGIPITDPITIPYYVDVLIRHLAATGKSQRHTIRFGTNPVSKGALKQLQEIWPIIQKVDQYRDDPETGGIKYRYWSRVTESLWFLVSANLMPEVIYLTDILLHHVKKVFKYNSTNRVFGGAINEAYRGRMLVSLSFMRAEVYKKNGEIEKAKQEYRNIYKEWEPNETLSTLTSSRVIEACTSLYLLEPTEENRQRVITKWNEALDYRIEFATEELREKCLITYMVAKHLFNYKIQ